MTEPQSPLKIMVSGNSDTVKEIRQALRENDGYCPCRIEKTEDTKCMCKEFREQTEPGSCHCGLYVKRYDDNLIENWMSRN
jgi:ferredoxin-thioredoxin reductase catalytic subunit